MAEVEERLSLDISEALTAVGTLEAALTGSAEGFTAAMDAAVAALQSQLESLSATPVAVDVSGDTSQLEAEVGQVAADPVVVDVDADTSAAEAALDALAGSASDLTESLGDVATATPKAGSGFEAAGTSATILSGGLAAAAKGGQSLGGVLQGITSKAGPVGISIAGVVTAVGTLGVGAIDADTAARRLDSSLGDLASNINNLSIGGLGDDLSAIAIAAASDDDALRLVAAGIADLGAASNKTRDESAALAETILTMAAKLAVLRPELGSAEQIADRLTPALAKGGRALTQFGLAAPTDQIAEMAAGLAGAGNEVTQFDKIAAGASIAVRQLTGDADKLAAAAESPALTFRRLTVALGETLEAAGSEILPDLVDTVESLTPAVVDLAGAFGDLVGAVSGPLAFAASGIAGFVDTVVDATRVTFDVTGAIVGGQGDRDNFNQSWADLTVIGGKAASTVEDIGIAAEGAGDPMDRLGDASGGTAAEFERFASAAKRADDQLSTGINAAEDRDQALRDARDSLRDLNAALAEHGPASQEAEDAGRRNAKALIELDEATIRMTGNDLKNSEATDIRISRYSALAKTLKGEARAEVEELIAGLKRLDGNDPRVSVNLDISEAKRRAQEMQAILDSLAGRVDAAAASERRLARAEGRAHGGPFHANQLLLVGEEGPELVRFNSGGTVINNTDSRALAGSGSTINVYEVGGDPYATAFAVGTELGKASTR